VEGGVFYMKRGGRVRRNSHPEFLSKWAVVSIIQTNWGFGLAIIKLLSMS
jgi:hypothetical protein